jgi:hypothetical protein
MILFLVYVRRSEIFIVIKDLQVLFRFLLCLFHIIREVQYCLKDLLELFIVQEQGYVVKLYHLLRALVVTIAAHSHKKAYLIFIFDFEHTFRIKVVKIVGIGIFGVLD